MDLKQIQDLIKFVAKTGVHEVKLERDDFKITIKTASEEKDRGEQKIYSHMVPQPLQQAMPQAQAAPAPAPTAPDPDPAKNTEASKNEAGDDSKYESIKAPMIGTFYRAAGPGKDPFIKVGDTVSKGDVVCIVEAMKLFNEIESEVSGKVIKVLVDDAAPVEYDQPLFLVDPS